ncbi:hypothetical protein CAPTEDRAFT_28290, partial [Capitella teleta]
TSGWLSRWKEHHWIGFKKAHREKDDADTLAAKTWTANIFSDILKEFHPRDIYNADETGIYFRALPDGTLAERAEKKARDRITALVANNMDGSDKQPLLIIGKSLNLRCFRGIAHKPLPYKANKNAWMTGELFRVWLKELNCEMRVQRRNVVMIVDICSAHPQDNTDKLSNVRLMFLPLNATSFIQPCDMGIIRNLKAFNRRK